MKNWKKYRKRIINAKTAGEFFRIVVDVEQDLVVNCCIRRNFGGCKSTSDEKCLACKLDWLNTDVEGTEGEYDING